MGQLSLDLQISSFVGQFKKRNAFLVYTICFNETVHDKWCLNESVGQTKNDLEHMVKLRLGNQPCMYSGLTMSLFIDCLFD